MRFRELKKQSRQKTEVSKEENNNYASYPDRIKAFIVDMFMIYTPILYIITYIFMDGKDDFLSSDLAPLIAVVLYGIIYAIFVSRTGQTPGKKAYDIKIIHNSENNKISFFYAFLRFIAFLFTAATLLGLLLPFYRKDKKALHDLLLNTTVNRV